MDYYERAPNWQKRIWGSCNINEESLSLLIIYLLNDNIAAAGDGGVINGKAAHSWSLVRKNDFSRSLKVWDRPMGALTT